MARILVVDDSDVFAEYSREILAVEHEVDVAHNGHAAAKLMRRNRYDLILTDIFMPDMDGFETIRATRQEHPDLPIIAMSGMAPISGRNGSLDFLTVANRLGAVATIHKPFAAAELKRLVASTLGGAPHPQAA